MKRCVKCGVAQPLDQFYRAKGTRDGLRGDCKPCFKERARLRYLADPAAAKARVKRWQQANPDRLNAYRRQRRLEPEVKRRERAGHLKRKYGISLEHYDSMLDDQGGGCAICKREPIGQIPLHVDHDHETGKIRGILCFTCNNALADFEDDPALLRSAVAYVEKPEADELDELIRRRARGLVGLVS
jgi:hypothetical protein